MADEPLIIAGFLIFQVLLIHLKLVGLVTAGWTWVLITPIAVLVMVAVVFVINAIEWLANIK